MPAHAAAKLQEIGPVSIRDGAPILRRGSPARTDGASSDIHTYLCDSGSIVRSVGGRDVSDRNGRMDLRKVLSKMRCQ